MSPSAAPSSAGNISDSTSQPPWMFALLAAHAAGDAANAERLMRAELTALAQLQNERPAALLPRSDVRHLADGLSQFAQMRLRQPGAQPWPDTLQQAWDRTSALLIASAQAQPVVALRSGHAGPITQDLAALLRDAGCIWPEEQELDWAVRWWQQARAAGLPVDADFGEVWRALEWLALLRHLTLIGQAGLSTTDPAPVPDVPRLVASVSKVALRYGPLKPLLRLLEPLTDTPAQAGFTF